MQIDAIEQRAGQPHLIIGGAANVGSALAGIARIAGAAASAWVHRRDQHEARRIGDAVIGAGDGDIAGLQRLTQRIQRLP